MTDQQALTRVLRNFAHTMASNYDTTQVLYDLSDNVAEVLGATAAGVALLEEEELRFVTATDSTSAAAERVQERLQKGPCVEAIRANEPVAIADLSEASRWPEYASAVQDIGYRAVLGLPLVLGGRRIGSIDVYSSEPRAWDAEAVDAARVLADIGAAYVLNASQIAALQRTAAQLQAALDSRVVIEQAKGVLAERVGVAPDEAFERIRSSARRHSIPLREVCERVITTEHIPD